MRNEKYYFLMNFMLFNVNNDAAVFCCHQKEIIARLKKDSEYEMQLPRIVCIYGMAQGGHTTSLVWLHILVTKTD